MRPSQEQHGGENAHQYQAGRDVAVHNHYHYEVAEERLQELAQRQEKTAIDLWEKNAPRLVQQAKDEFAGRAIEMTREVIKNVIAENADNLELFGQTRAQIPLLKAQNSYGETGNKEVVPHLASLVAQLITSEPQSYIEMLSRRGVDCITNMTSEHLNLVTVIAKLQHRWFPRAVTVKILANSLRKSLGVYFRRIPTEAIEYSYITPSALANAARTSGVGSLAFSPVPSMITVHTEHFGPRTRTRCTTAFVSTNCPSWLRVWIPSTTSSGITKILRSGTLILILRTSG
ncbi:LPO_1073/Vpar_1526 family protein [Mycobacterium sp. IS-1742]|uniref:LPO_1073/Vpar_1526 family protein n=1 Tax=Mycobacterium sp. IS-1742 TaxID=1772285 RepID=UPI000AE8701C|nr:LPO_1073/Vpar_1526 family protein [Mycobacterium sp. IS-1742]